MYDTMPIEIAASGMNAQRIRMGAIASNLANAESTRGPDGGPYQRRLVRLQAQPVATYTDVLENALRDSKSLGEGEEPRFSEWMAEQHLRGVSVTSIEKDPGVIRKFVGIGQHPDADEKGVLTLPNIRVVEEMTDMIMASRLYEGNVAVVKNTKDMITQLFDLLRK